jgi:hypothetical protein
MYFFTGGKGWFGTSPYHSQAASLRGSLLPYLHDLHHLHCFLIALKRELAANGYQLLRRGISDRVLVALIARLFYFSNGEKSSLNQFAERGGLF